MDVRMIRSLVKQETSRISGFQAAIPGVTPEIRRVPFSHAVFAQHYAAFA